MQPSRKSPERSPPNSDNSRRDGEGSNEGSHESSASEATVDYVTQEIGFAGYPGGYGSPDGSYVSQRTLTRRIRRARREK